MFIKNNSNSLKFSINFKIGEIFPPKSEIAHFVIGLSIITNDLIYTNNVLIKKLDNPDSCKSSNDWIKYLLLSISQYREAVKYFYEMEKSDDIKKFLITLPIETIKSLEKFKKSFDPWGYSFTEQKLKPIRDRFYHYDVLLLKGEFERVLSEISDWESNFKLYGDRYADTCLDFAELIRVNLLEKYLGKSTNSIGEMLEKTGEYTGNLIRLFLDILTAYILMLPKELYQVENIDDP